MAKNEQQLFLYWKVHTHVNQYQCVFVRINENCQSCRLNDCLLMTAEFTLVKNALGIDFSYFSIILN